MKSILILSLILTTASHAGRSDNSNYQNNKLTKEFISFIKKTNSLEDRLLLVDKPETREFKNCLEWISHDSSIVGSASREFIIKAIDQPSLTSWTSELTGTPFFISKDTISNIFTGARPRGWDYFNKRYGSHYYIFSSPVFFNNGTMCLFYIDYHCGELCNEGKIRLYKKDNHGWKVLKEFCSWMS